ncbi:MAG: pyridoxamine 5'-phosphate oxidase family protein [Pseudomonadota bacterium]
MSAPTLSIDEVQSAVGRLAGARDLKVINYLDEHAQRWLMSTQIIFLSQVDGQSIDLTLAMPTKDTFQVVDQSHIAIAHQIMDEPHILKDNSGFSLLCLVPGMNETLRINGSVQTVADDTVTLEVQECYLHCGKALIRSDFWSNESQPALGEPADLASQSRFLALATSDKQSHADISPKGDPADSLAYLDANGIFWIPDRPGNRRIDSFRNMIERPDVALIALDPGNTQVLKIIGQAAPDDNLQAREMFAVEGKTPHLVTRIEPTTIKILHSKTLANTNLWQNASNTPPFDAPEIFKTHVKLSKERGIGATMARAAVSVPGMMSRGLKSDYEKNLY